MLKALIILPILFSFWFGLVKIFSKNEESSINILSKKVIDDFNLIFRNILDIVDSLFKNFIQIYELIGFILKNIAVIFKSLISTFAKFFNLFKVIVITFVSFISLCKGLYQETQNVNIFNSLEAILNQTKSAKNNVVRLFKIKSDELNTKEVTLDR